MDQLQDEFNEIPDSQPLLLIADCHLLDFPLELLPQFKNRPISRDFSIQIHQERMNKQEDNGKDKKAKGGKGGSDENIVPISKILALGTPGKCLNMLTGKTRFINFIIIIIITVKSINKAGLSKVDFPRENWKLLSPIRPVFCTAGGSDFWHLWRPLGSPLST